MKASISEPQMYLVVFILFGLISLTITIALFINPALSEEVLASRLAADMGFYIGALSSLEKDEKGEVEISVERPFDIEIEKLDTADLERAKHISKTFRWAGTYVTASLKAKDGKEKKGSTVFIVGDVPEAKFTASSFIKIIKEPESRVRFEYA